MYFFIYIILLIILIKKYFGHRHIVVDVFGCVPQDQWWCIFTKWLMVYLHIYNVVNVIRVLTICL